MYKNILIPTDGSDLAAKAVEQGVLFAKEIGAKITAMTVTEPFHMLSVDLRRGRKQTRHADCGDLGLRRRRATRMQELVHFGAEPNHHLCFLCTRPGSEPPPVPG